MPSPTIAVTHSRDTKVLLAEIGRDDCEDLAKRGIVG